jgi:hypothetical protein
MDLSIVLYSDKKQSFRNWICFPTEVKKWGVSTWLSPVHLRTQTDPVSETLCSVQNTSTKISNT